MSYNQLHGYLIKDTQVKMIKKYIPSLIEGNSYEDPNGATGSFKLKSFRKYTWTSPDSKDDSQYIRYAYHVEVEFDGTYALWNRVYSGKDWKYMAAYRKKSIQRSLKYIAERLISDSIKVIDHTVQPHNITVKKVTLKTKED